MKEVLIIGQKTFGKGTVQKLDEFKLWANKNY
jgi:C-terminal processing protease CtpA/Prc